MLTRFSQFDIKRKNTYIMQKIFGNVFSGHLVESFHIFRLYPIMWGVPHITIFVDYVTIFKSCATSKVGLFVTKISS